MSRFRKVAGTVVYGAQLGPYYRIGGNIAYQPPFLGIVQTDGSRSPLRGSRVAMILTTRDRMNIHKQMLEISETADSTETEWAAVSHGLEFALQKGETMIGIENDNLAVVGALITGPGKSQKEYVRYYSDRILRFSKLSLWTGIRWIPREINLADDLFR